MVKQRLEECVYCGTTGGLTDEHVPPKLIFSKPRPSDLITVRACRRCNQAGAKDAEYFRLCLCLNPLTKNQPDVVVLKPIVRRSLERAEGQGFNEYFRRAMKPERGMISLRVEMERIHAVIRRIVQCLYAHETGNRLPNTHESRVASLEVLSRLGPDKVREFHTEFVEPLANQEWRLVAKRQFAYSVIHTVAVHGPE